jgi:hypothetical protein
MRIFKALTTWHCQDMKSTYCEGLTYTVRDESSSLAIHAEQWVKDGKAAWIRPGATMQGTDKESLWMKMWRMLTWR